MRQFLVVVQQTLVEPDGVEMIADQEIYLREETPEAAKETALLVSAEDCPTCISHEVKTINEAS